MKFSIKDFFSKCDQIRRRPNPQEAADLVTFTEKIRNGKLHFLCSASFICAKQAVIKPNNQAVIKPFLNSKVSLRKKCPYSEFFSSVFTRILIEYGKKLPISPYSVPMREKADQKKSE